MPYRIPKEEVLVDAIRAALTDQAMVISQAKLTRIVKAKLKDVDPDFTASEKRIRHLAMTRRLAKVDIECRDTVEKSRATRCPVCGSKMSRIQNETIFGGRVTLGYKCRSCTYWTGIKRRVPVRYIFYGDEKKFPRHQGVAKIDGKLPPQSDDPPAA
jgi:formate dehydrogenase maturation protein FdhE